jgi:hypothetical protein
MRTSRRLKAWEQAGLIRRNAEVITVTGSVTPTVTEDTAAVTEAADVTRMSGAERARRSTTPVRLAAFVVALALACVSAAFSIDGLTVIFAGAFWPIIIMGAVLEAGKQVAAAWLTEHWTSAPSLLRLILVLMIGVLMGLNAIGVFGFLTRAHLDHMASVDLAHVWPNRRSLPDAPLLPVRPTDGLVRSPAGHDPRRGPTTPRPISER